MISDGFLCRTVPNVFQTRRGLAIEKKSYARYREAMPAQPVDATPSAINLFSKGGVYDAAATGKAFRDPAERHVEALEGRTVVA